MGQCTHTIAEAMAFVAARNWSGLLRYASAWTNAEPTDAMGWFYLSNTYGIGLARPDQVLPSFQHAVALRSNRPEAWNALGILNFQLKKYDDAKAFSHVVEQAPTRANHRDSLAAAYSFAGRSSMAVKTLEDEQSAAARRATFKDWNNLGTSEGVLGKTQAALNDYRRSATLDEQTGANNATRLHQQIAAAQGQLCDDSVKAYWRGQARQAEIRASDASQKRLGRNQN